jgi:hypothetical protein
MTTATATPTAPEMTLIDEVMAVVSSLDLQVLDDSKQIENVEERREFIGKYMIDVAHQLGLMKRTKSHMTMREKVYFALATHLAGSKKIYSKLGINPDVIKTCPNAEKLIEINKWKIKLV